MTPIEFMHYMCIYGGSVERKEFLQDSDAVKYFTAAHPDWERISVWDDEDKCWYDVGVRSER